VAVTTTLAYWTIRLITAWKRFIIQVAWTIRLITAWKRFISQALCALSFSPFLPRFSKTCLLKLSLTLKTTSWRVNPEMSFPSRKEDKSLIWWLGSLCRVFIFLSHFLSAGDAYSGKKRALTKNLFLSSESRSRGKRSKSKQGWACTEKYCLIFR